MIVLLIAVLLATSLSCADAGFQKGEYKGITTSELKAHVKYLASDQLEGRGTGTQGHLKAAAYAAAQFQEYGLIPLAGLENPQNPYFQEVPLWRIQRMEENELTITVSGESHRLRAADGSFVLNPNTNVQPGMVRGKPVYVGNGIRETDLGWDDFKGLDLQDRIVVMRVGVPRDETGGSILSEERSRFYQNMEGPGPLTILENITSRGASALIVLPNDELLQNWAVVRSNYMRAVRDQEGYEALQTEPDLPILVLNREGSIFLMSRLTDDPFQPQSIGFRGEMADVEVTLSIRLEWTKTSSPNVVGVVEGTDPELRDQYIVAGAHLDHLGIIGGRIHNGAVDNATGSAVILEVAESISADPLPRPVVFILFTAEEVGHYGSLQFVNRGPIPIEKMMAHVNVDHAGRDNPMFDDILVAGLDRIDQRVDGIVRVANQRAGARLYFSEGMSERDYSGSDHYSFDQAGIPSVVFGTGRFDGYHRPDDDEEFVEYRFTFDMAKITLETIRELGNLETPLKHRQERP